MWGLAITTSLASPFVRSSNSSEGDPRAVVLLSETAAAIPRTSLANLTTLTPPDPLAARGHMTRGLKLQDQPTEREQDLFACASFRCGGIWSVRPFAELITQKGSEHLKLCNRSVQQLRR